MLNEMDFFDCQNEEFDHNVEKENHMINRESEFSFQKFESESNSSVELHVTLEVEFEET